LTSLAEKEFDLENEPFLMNFMIRYNNSYRLYDDFIKKYINMTAFTLTEN
jgi:hypothetical protein